MNFIIKVHMNNGCQLNNVCDNLGCQNKCHDPWYECLIMMEIFDNASNINLISKNESEMEDFVVEDGMIFCDYETKNGNKFCLSFIQALRYTDCDCDTLSDLFIEEIIQAFEEYYNVKFEYYETNFIDDTTKKHMVIQLYENHK